MSESPKLLFDFGPPRIVREPKHKSNPNPLASNPLPQNLAQKMLSIIKMQADEAGFKEPPPPVKAPTFAEQWARAQRESTAAKETEGSNIVGSNIHAINRTENEA